MPKAGIHRTRSVNCMAADSGTKRTRTKTASASSTSAMVRAEVRTISSSSNSQSTVAPTTGRKRIQDRIGNPAVSSSSMNAVSFGEGLHLSKQLNDKHEKEEPRFDDGGIVM